MKNYRSIKLVNFFLAALIVTGTVLAEDDFLPFYNSEEFTPNWIEPGSPELDDFHRIPAFSFTNQTGEVVNEDTFEGKIFVANFFFSTCPGICPTVRSKMITVQDEFIDDDQVLLISHSIRPSTDTVERLKKYAETHGINNKKWHLVTGDKEQIYGLAKSAYFANEDLGNIQDLADFLHTENVLLVDQNKHIRGVYNGLSASSMTHLRNDIATLKAEM